jgi:alkylation response protein AidB-like acyl-CoA dehydrogenase
MTNPTDLQPAVAREHQSRQEPGREDQVTVAGIRAAIAPVLEHLKATAADRELRRELPYAEVKELAERRVLWLLIPRADGGAGATTRELFEVVIDIARADSNVAQALRSSFLTTIRAAGRAEPDARARLVERVLAGHVFAGTTNERGVASGAVATRLRRQGDGFVVSGTKYYSTGGLYANWFTGTATDDDGEVVSFTVPTDREGVECIDDFDAVGQRMTASGSTRLTDVRVTADEIDRPDRGRRNPFTSAAQLYLAAVEAGIAGAVLDDAVWFANERARAIKHSSATSAVGDPYVRHAVGEISARGHAARAAVLFAAETLDAAWAGEYDRHVLIAAAVTVAEAQFIAVESALKSAELLFDVGGGGATDREHNFDRHWRNARTVANHNPRAWKAGVIGGYRLTGEEPPTTGLF